MMTPFRQVLVDLDIENSQHFKILEAAGLAELAKTNLELINKNMACTKL